MNIIGGLSDQTTYLVWSQISNLFSISNPILANFFPYKHFFGSFTNPLLSNQPLGALFLSLFLTLARRNGFNILIVLTILSNLFFSYLYFKKFKYGFVYALLFCFSSYFWIHLGVHIALMQIWVFPLFFYALSKCREFSLRNPIFIGLLISVVTAVSNYYGFFILIFFSFYVFVKVIVEYISEKKLLKSFLRFYFISISVSLLSLSVFLIPFFKSQYLSYQSESHKLERTFEDFVTFSSRPWYFVIPPVKNPFLGEIGKSIVSRLKSTNYFLADDYFATEHSGSYFGIFFLLSTIILGTYTFLRSKEKMRREVLVLFLVSTLVFLFTMPPYFTFSGLKIYTPGFLIYKFFPMFRVTARMSILLLICLLTIFGMSFDFVLSRFRDRKLVLRGFLAILLGITLMEVYVPVKVVKYEKPPEVYTYLKTNTPADSRFVVYPYHKTQEALFWLPVHERSLINIRDYTYGDFSSEDFTKSLNTPLGLESVKVLGTDYVIVHKDIKEEESMFFVESAFLNLEKKFDSCLLYSVRRYPNSLIK